MVQRQVFVERQSFVVSIPAGIHARLEISARAAHISGAQYCCSSWTGHAFGVNNPLEAFSVPPHNTDLRSEVHDILECKQVIQKSGSGASASSISENFILQNSEKATYIRKPN